MKMENVSRELITRKDVIDSPAEVGQLVVEDDSGARREDLRSESVRRRRVRSVQIQQVAHI